MDYYTVRAHPDGSIVPRDAVPNPRPAEAITWDDYYQIKLEHIFLGDELLPNQQTQLAIITEIDGVLPEGVTCREIDMSDLQIDLEQRERANYGGSSRCAYKHVVSVAPVVSNAHLTFDSAYITPPFHMFRTDQVRLRFLIAELHDVSLARDILGWLEERSSNLSEIGLEELSGWHAEVVNIGFTAANAILEYASQPDHVFEYETSFVLVESVGDTRVPQNLFMGGDYVIVGFPETEVTRMLGRAGASGADHAGALAMAPELIFDSGRIYWRDGRNEYRDSAYVVYKVVRQSRLPRELPVDLARLDRDLERDTLDFGVRGFIDLVFEMEDVGVLNSTEGTYLRDLFEWYGGAYSALRELDAARDGERPAPADWPYALQEVPRSLGNDLALLPILERTGGLLDRLEDRIYDNYGNSPGMLHSECVVLRRSTQRMVDTYSDLLDITQRAYEDLQIARSREAAGSPPYQRLAEAELWAGTVFERLPGATMDGGRLETERVSEPSCPGLSRR